MSGSLRLTVNCPPLPPTYLLPGCSLQESRNELADYKAMVRERLAVLYEDRAAREAQYAHASAKGSEALKTTDERLRQTEVMLHATTRDYLHLRRESQDCHLREIRVRENAAR